MKIKYTLISLPIIVNLIPELAGQPLACVRAGERKVRVPQGRMLPNGKAGRPAESATENIPPPEAPGLPERVKR